MEENKKIRNLKEINVSNLSQVKISNENVEIKKDKDQLTINENIADKSNVFEESSLDDTKEENKPPVKKLAKFQKKKKKIPKRNINMRKVERAQLNGQVCWECEKYYKALSLSAEELQKRKNLSSRHRHKHERPRTPEGFWDPEIPE